MASVDEYGYITLDENTEINTTSGGSNNHHNNNSGGHGFAIVLRVLVFAVVIWFVITGISNNQNDLGSSNDKLNNSSNYSQNEDAINTQQEDDDLYNYSTENDESGEYILPNSDSSYISYSDLYNLSQTEVSLARNEIYARHGRKFNTDSIREYFESKTWYEPYIDPDDFSESVFNEYEKENIKTIVNYEKDKGWK